LVYINKGTKEFKRASLALFFAGFVIFATLYSTQPLLPVLSKEFNVSPTVASLTLSLTTGILAISMIFAAAVSDTIGKKRVMVLSMFLTSILGLLTALSPNFVTLLPERALLGVFIAGVPSIAMAYVGEEFRPEGIGVIMGLYVAGTSIGGMSGRIFTGILTDLFNWRVALVCIGILTFILTIIFIYILPEPRNRVKKRFDWKSAIAAYQTHLRNKRIMSIILLAFLLQGSFVTLYNYIGYLLEAPPYGLSQTLIGFIFIVYLAGTWSSVYMGKKADQFGNASMLKLSLGIMIIGAILTLVPFLIGKILGLIIFTFGFFACHSIASAWVGEKAKGYKAQASSMYLLFYYMGSSIVGAFGGIFWSNYEWGGVITLISVLLALGFPLVFVAENRKQAVSGEKAFK
jgi:YNFM family putative membrane transporter